jgi:hypothetical protein
MKTDKIDDITRAADLLGGALRRLLATDQGLHAETAIASAARLAGTLVLRSFGRELAGVAPGTQIVSRTTDGYGRSLVDTLFVTLQQMGHPDMDGASLRGRSETTALSRLSLAETRQRLEPWFKKTAEVSGLSLTETAAAAAMSAAALIHDCRPVLDVHAGCSIAVHGIVESLGTMPEPLRGVA